MSINNNREEEDDVGCWDSKIAGCWDSKIPRVGCWDSKIPRDDTFPIPTSSLPPLPPPGLRVFRKHDCLICNGPHYEYLCPLRLCCPLDKKLGDDYKLICVSCSADIISVFDGKYGKCAQGCVRQLGDDNKLICVSCSADIISVVDGKYGKCAQGCVQRFAKVAEKFLVSSGGFMG